MQHAGVDSCRENARPEMKKKIMKPVKKSWIYQP